MTAKDWSREIAALVPYVKGCTLEMGLAHRPRVPGTQLVARTQLINFDGLHEWDAGAVDAIVSITGLEAVPDTLKCLREWRRVLREDGVVALVLEHPRFAESGDDILHRYTPAFLSGIVNLVGGYTIDRVEPIVEGESWLCVMRRNAAAMVRNPFAVLAPDIAAVALQDQAIRGELYFSIGALLLQGGDPALAEACFKALLQLEPTNADGMFGLGMCYGTLGRWQEALTEMSRVVARDPQNAEAQRWLELAQRQVKAAASAAAAQDAPTAPTVLATPAPRCAPAPAAPASPAVAGAVIPAVPPAPKAVPVAAADDGRARRQPRVGLRI